MFDMKRVASKQDVVDVAALAHAIWTDHYLPIIGQAQVEYMLEKFQSVAAITQQIAEGYEYYLALDNKDLTGYLAVVPDPVSSTLMISKIYVKRTLRGHGIGEQMLAIAEMICCERGLATLWLTVNKHNSTSISWYERMGFVNVGDLLSNIGNGFVMDDFKMEKNLPLDF